MNCCVVTAAGAAGSPYLGRHVEHHGYDGRVLVAVDGEAHFTKPLTEIDGVLRQLANPLAAWPEHTRRTNTLDHVNLQMENLLSTQHVWMFPLWV